MARSDLLISLLRAAKAGDQALLNRVAEALIAEERAKNHNVLADRLTESLRQNGAAPPSLPKGNGDEPQRLMFESTPNRPLEHLILTNAVKQACVEVIEEQCRADLLRSYGLEPRHRLLLTGPPGNGKTSLAEAVAYELALPLLTVRYEGVIGSFLGETASRVSSLFEFVRSRHCVLFFDEFDAIAKERGDPHDTGEVKRVVSSLLLQVDALPTYVVVITATNHAELLDRAVWRRFQLRLQLDSPNSKQRREMLGRVLARDGQRPTTLVNDLSRELAGLSFAELEEFGYDVQRKRVLSEPDASLAQLTRSRLEQWRERAKPHPAK